MKEEYVWTLVAFFTFTIFFSLIWTDHIEEKEYIKKGYQQVIVKGRQSPMWRKCGGNNE